MSHIHTSHINTENEQIGIFTSTGDKFKGKPILVIPDDAPSKVEALMLFDEGTIRWLTTELLNITDLPPEPIRGIHATETQTLADLDSDALDEYRNDRDGT